MSAPRLTVKQFAALCTAQQSPPWTLKIQPGQSAKSVSLNALIDQVSSTEVIVFADLRNGTIFENYPGVISNYVQAYIFSRTCLSTADLNNLITALTQNSLGLVYISPTMQRVGIRGTVGNLQAIILYSLGQITSVGNTLTTSSSTGEAGQSQSTVFWQNGAIGGSLLVGGGAVAKVGLSWVAMNARAVSAGRAAYWAFNSASADGLAATVAADGAAAVAAANTAGEAAYLAALGDTALGGFAVLASEVATSAAVSSLLTIGLPILAAAGIGLAVAGVGILVWNHWANSTPPPVNTPVTPPAPAPANIAPQNVPQGLPVIAPVNTTPPTYGPQPPELRNDLISSTPYTNSSNELLGVFDPNSPPYPNSYSALVANSAAGYLANPWQFLASEVSPPGIQQGTGPALTAEIQGFTNPTTGESFTWTQMTNPASGQVLTITGPGAVGLGSSTSIISDSIANKTEATTTNITIDQTTEIAQIEVSQSLGAYAPNSLPPQASSGTGGPVIGSGTGPGTGTGTGTGTGSDGTDGTDEGTDGTDETGTTTGSIIIGGTGLGPGSPGTSGG